MLSQCFPQSVDEQVSNRRSYSDKQKCVG